jgi:PAS domain S-box-containing protein
MMTRHVGPVGTIITDISQTILHIDDRYSEIVYRERASLIGQQALSFTYADDLPANKPVLDKLSGNGAGFTIVKRYVRSDGNLVWVRNHVTKITDGLGCCAPRRS